jgi:hypothetical protein
VSTEPEHQTPDTQEPKDKATRVVSNFEKLAAARPYYALFLLWLTIAGLWKTVEVSWMILRGLARLIA